MIIYVLGLVYTLIALLLVNNRINVFNNWLQLSKKKLSQSHSQIIGVLCFRSFFWRRQKINRTLKIYGNLNRKIGTLFYIRCCSEVISSGKHVLSWWTWKDTRPYKKNDAMPIPIVDGSDHMLPNKILVTIKHKFCDIKLMPPNSTKNKKKWLYCTS